MTDTTTLHDRFRQLITEIASYPEAPKASDFHLDDQGDIDTLVAVGFVSRTDVEDLLGATTAGRDFAGLLPQGVPSLPVEVAEITGNIAESELVARYLGEKIEAIDRYISKGREPSEDRTMDWKESYQHTAIILRETAKEIRLGLHLPSVHINGRVEHYNEDRATGIAHAASLYMFFGDVYARNLKAGWWTDINTGQPKKRNVGELFILMVTELVEAYEAYLDGSQDDKLPQYPGVGVEMGDLLIRIADFCGALQAGNIIFPDAGSDNPGQKAFDAVRKIATAYESIRKTPAAVGVPETADLMPAMDVSIMVDAKLAFNATRADHQIENRLKEDGKRT